MGKRTHYLLIQHCFGSVGHDTLGIAGLLAVDKDDPAEPADETNSTSIDQLLLCNHSATVW